MGDGTIYEGPIISHYYEKVGTYNITLSIFNLTELVKSINFSMDVEPNVTMSQIILVTLSIFGIPLLIIASLNVAVIVGGWAWRKYVKPDSEYVKWKWKSVSMFNLLLITVPLALVLAPPIGIANQQIGIARVNGT